MKKPWPSKRACCAVLLAGVVCCAAGKWPEASAKSAEIGAFGLDLAARKPSVKPGDDFYQYANGAWLDSANIPADRGAYGPGTTLSELSERRLRTIVEKASRAAAQAGSKEQKIADYYASYMDQDAIDALGPRPIAADLKRIAAADSRGAIATLFGSPGFTSIYALSIGADPKSPNRYAIDIRQSGLGLPDRDYYLNTDKSLNDIRQKYLAHIARLLELA